MVELSLKVDLCLFWIDFKFKPELDLVVTSSPITTSSSLCLTWQSIQNKKEPSSTILGTYKCPSAFTLAHHTCKLEFELKLCVVDPTA